MCNDKCGTKMVRQKRCFVAPLAFQIKANMHVSKAQAHIQKYLQLRWEEDEEENTVSIVNPIVKIIEISEIAKALGFILCMYKCFFFLLSLSLSFFLENYLSKCAHVFDCVYSIVTNVLYRIGKRWIWTNNKQISSDGLN